MASWSPGEQINSYEVIGVLGRGGMGKVYRVRHRITDRIEAMKVIASAATAGPETLERFHREIRVLATLAHPNIAGLYNAFHFQDQLMMVMEYVPGTDLSLRLKSGLTLEQSLDYTRQILKGLEYAHSRNVIHRDIKPSNVMVTDMNQVKLLDFGLALSGVETRLTNAGSLVGSMHYVAPEVISGKAADARTDLYALGVTVYEMITGRLPIEGSTYAQIIANHLTQQPTPPKRLNDKIPEALSLAVMKALDKDRERRWPGASAFLEALDAADLGNAGDLLVTSTKPNILSPVKPVHAQTTSATLQPQVLNDIAVRLAAHVGPIANVLVRRASSNVHNVRELCDLVAKEIESTDARQKFMNSVQHHLRASSHH
jgi:eukaryotic-like serine/threonine-protein kinase